MKYWFFLLTIFLAYPSAALCRDLPFTQSVDNIPQELYGGESQIWTIAVGENGFAFFGAGTKLCVWDGNLWSKYALNGISIIRSLQYDKASKRLYCVADNLFGFWTMDVYGNWIFTELYRNEDFSRNQIFWKILLHDHSLYVQTHESILCYDLKTRRTRSLLANNTINFMDKLDGHIVLQVDGKLWFLDNNTLIDLHITFPDKIIGIARVDGDWVAVSEKAGIRKISNGLLTDLFPSTNRKLIDMRPFSATYMGNGKWLVGTILDGAYIVNRKGEVESAYNERLGLSYTTVLSVAYDAIGNIWLGLDGGLSYIKNNPCELYYKNFGRKIGCVYTSLLFNGDLYLGTNKGLYRIDKNNEANLIAGFHGQVWDLKASGEEMAIVFNDGLYGLDKEGRSRLILPNVWKYEPWNGTPNLYWASDNSGIIVMEVKQGRIRVRNRLTNYDGYVNNSLKIDKYGNVWVDELFGKVSRLLIDSDWQSVVKKQDYAIHGAEKKLIKATVLDGDVVFTVGNDCYSFDVTNGTIVKNDYYTHLCHELGSHGINLFQIGSIFFNYGDDGIRMVSRQSDSILIKSGLFENSWQSAVPNRYRRFVQLNDSLIATGISEGLAVYNIRAQRNYSRTKIQLYRMSYKLGDEEFLVAIRQDAPMSLPYSASNLKFYFAGVRYGHPCKYRIDRQPWSTIPLGTPISIAYLNSGHHVLELIMEHGDRKELLFNIRPHFTSTWWFICCMLAITAAVGYGVYRFYKYRIELVTARFAQARREMLEREKIHHDNEMLSFELRERDKKLTSFAMNDININNILNDIDSRLEHAISPSNAELMRPVKQAIENYRRDNGTWEVFKAYFNTIYDGFFDRLINRYPKLTNNDLKICAYIRLGMSTKEIATLMHIETASAESARYRLRKNMGLQANESLTELISKI